MKLISVSLNALIACLIGMTAAQNFDWTPAVPIFRERSFTMNKNTSTPRNVGRVNQSTSYLVTSQDFQGIYVDRKTYSDPPERIVFNFGECCRSSNTTTETLQALNQNGILYNSSIDGAPKVALVKRGNCNWSEKIAVAKSFPSLINISAVFIYDNNDYSEVQLSSTQITGSGSLAPPTFSTPLPPSRNILNMTDNDLNIMNSSDTVVYFIPFKYGDAFVQRINASFNSSTPDIRQYWLSTAYLQEVSWGNSGSDSFFSTGRGYLAYIIALAALFIIGVIFLRWWRIRRIRQDYPNGFNGFSMANGFNMQPRVSRVDPLPVDIVNALPIDKYSEELIKNTNCAICLEDFVPAKTDVRILPCGHGFCVLCIDPWLTQKSTMCPICKWDCLPVDLRRERDELLRQQQQQQQLHQGNQPIPPESLAINMDVPGPSTPTTAVVAPSPQHTTGIVPPTLLPASSPPPDATAVQNETIRNEKSPLTPSLENPFEPTNESQLSESSRSPRTNTPPPHPSSLNEADPTSSEKKSTQ